MPPDPPVDAGAIPQRQFSSARRGLDPGEVRAYLHELAKAVADLQRREERERRRADRAEERAARAEHPDHNFLVEMLGEETARVLDAARDAARDIRGKAEVAAERLISEANEQAHTRRAEGEAELLALRNEMLAEVDGLRAEAAAELDRRRAEAEELVQEICREAELAADGLRRQGEKERASAAAEAESLQDAAREEARRMIDEARSMRARVLNDLGRRRRVAREQLERLNAARARLLAAYEVVRRTVDEATGELDIALPEARAAGDNAMRRVQQEPEPTIDDMESQVSMARIAGLLPPLPEVEHPELDALLDDGVDDVAYEGVVGREAPSTPASPVDVDSVDVTEPAAAVDDDVLPVDARPATDPDPVLSEPHQLNGGEPGGADEPADEPAAGVPTAQQAPAVTAEDAFARLRGTVTGPPADAVLLRQRDETLEPLERALARRLKRVLADEQNEVLDLVRRGRAEEDPDALLPSAGDHAARYADAAADELHTAAYWGAAAAGSQPAGSCDDLADALGEHLAEPFRERFFRSVAEADGHPDEVTDRLRALYREWKSRRVADAAKHYVAAAYARGAYDAVPAGGRLRWVVDPRGLPCPDAEDNTLAGAVRKGDPFPTGHCVPPAHPGCRCMIVAADAAVAVSPVSVVIGDDAG